MLDASHGAPIEEPIVEVSRLRGLILDDELREVVRIAHGRVLAAGRLSAHGRSTRVDNAGADDAAAEAWGDARRSLAAEIREIHDA